jgi:hypothetical protein
MTSHVRWGEGAAEMGRGERGMKKWRKRVMMTMRVVMGCVGDGRRTVLILMMLMLVMLVMLVVIKLRTLILVNTRSGLSVHKFVIFPTSLHNTDDIADQQQNSA